jgi:DNA-binding NarL/FixJ family response regulator
VVHVTESPHRMGELPVVPPSPTPLLSQRQLLVVQLLAIEMSTTQIAATMSTSVNTVRTRARRAVRKLGADDRRGAVQTARDHGLV